MKKALIITTISGFLAQFELNDVTLLQELGYEVHYASNFNNPVYEFDEEKLRAQGIQLHQIDVQKSPKEVRANCNAYRQLRKLIDDEQIDLIHCHNPMGAVVARCAAFKSKRKTFVIYTAHGFHFYKGAPWLNWILYYPVERFLAHFTNVIVTINQEDYRRACKFYLKKPGFVEQIPGVGVDMKRFCKRTKVTMGLGIPANGFHIVTAAELNENKNQRVVIEAIHKLPYSDIYYSICGKGMEQGALLDLIHRYRLQDRIWLLGYRNDMEEILQSADCFAFPSYREGLGIAAIEALACGVPLIAAKNRGTKEYVKENVNGIFCEAGNAESFAKAIEKLYTDAKYRKYLAEGCRQSALVFSCEETIAKMKQVYKKADEYVENRGKG